MEPQDSVQLREKVAWGQAEQNTDAWACVLCLSILSFEMLRWEVVPSFVHSDRINYVPKNNSFPVGVKDSLSFPFLYFFFVLVEKGCETNLNYQQQHYWPLRMKAWLGALGIYSLCLLWPSFLGRQLIKLHLIPLSPSLTHGPEVPKSKMKRQLHCFKAVNGDMIFNLPLGMLTHSQLLKSNLAVLTLHPSFLYSCLSRRLPTQPSDVKIISNPTETHSN